MKIPFGTMLLVVLSQACARAPERLDVNASKGGASCDSASADCVPGKNSGDGKGGVNGENGDALPEEDLKSTGFGLARVWRLTPIQVNNTITSLFKKNFKVDERFGAETRPASGFGTDSSTLKLDSSYVASLSSVIDELVKDPKELLNYTKCKTFETLTADCVAVFVKEFGAKAFRRDLTADEEKRYQNVYNTVKAGLGAAEGLSAVAEAMLRSPYTNFRFELGEQGTASRRLSGPELASALAFATTNAPPDDDLLNLGKNGEILKAEIYAAEVDRHLAKPEFQEAFVEFMMRYTGIKWLPNLKKQSSFPIYSEAMSKAMADEVKAYVRNNLLKEKASFKSLMTGTKSTITPPLAEIYGLPKFTEASKVIDFNPSERVGLINLPGVITANSPADHSGPVQRGIFVLQKFMCFTPPAPPADVPTELPMTDGAKSLRELFVLHEKVASCAACHKFIDPPGFAFEPYDAIGRARTKDDYGAAVFSEGVIRLDAKEVKFKNSSELAPKLSESPEVQGCFVANAFEYVLGRSAEKKDAATIAAAKKAFTDSSLDMRSVMKSFLLSDTFRYRAGE